MSIDPPARIPMKGGDEYDALTTGGRRVHDFRAGQRKAAKRSYMRRLRRQSREATRNSVQGDA